MKKIALLTVLLTLVASVALFAGTPRIYSQKVVLESGEILDLVANTGATHNPDYIVRAQIVETGETLGTDLGTVPGSIRICKTGNGTAVPYFVAMFLQLGTFPTQWVAGQTISMTVTYIPTGEVATWTKVIDPGTTTMLYTGAGQEIVVPPYAPAGHTLTVNSNYPGAAIYLDGADTGEVTPFTFDPADAGTYTVVLPNVEWTPAEYVYTAEADETVGFVGVLNPAVPTITFPEEAQVFTWEAAQAVTITWENGAIIPDYYEYNWNGGDWLALAAGVTEWTTPELEEGAYNFQVRGVIEDPTLGSKTFTKARFTTRNVSNSPKGTGAVATVNFSVVIEVTPDYPIVPGVPATVGDAEVTITGPGFVGAFVGTEGLADVPNPSFVATSEGILTLVGSGLVDITLDFDPAVDWLIYWIGGAPVVIAGPLTTYTIVGIDLGAKDATLEYKGGMGGDPTLPVELSVFNAVLTAQKFVKLTWVSESETNMLGYRVYRSETNDANSATQITAMMIEATNTSTTQVYSIEDREVLPFSTYYYWLEAVDYNHSNFFGPQFVEVPGEVVPELPVQTAMKNAYPNPFKTNASTNIEVALKAGETGTVTIYNVLGQVVKTYKVNEGSHTLTWNGRDSKGNACGSGIYFYKLSTPSMNQTKKMVIVK